MPLVNLKRKIKLNGKISMIKIVMGNVPCYYKFALGEGGDLFNQADFDVLFL
ncbi:hypothetical protein [Bacillus sp. SM2101]|uniref:hypothetical protein n=1 Tax=Bacillus sp. SM2101 TaxID=2805366 RepID=UPI001BDF3E74|nr:hypothetical protein [Bacillus sp. SM2101]